MPRSNFESNKDIWNNYAKTWNKQDIIVENTEVSQEERSAYIQYLGDEWGRSNDVVEIVEEYIYPFVERDSKVAEIGVGGGRIAAKIVEKVGEFHGFDIAEEMLSKAKEVLAEYPLVKLHLMEKPEFEKNLEASFDFVYAFDVFVHLDLRTLWKYINEIGKILNKSGKAFIHTSNIMAPDGWTSFVNPKSYGEKEELYYPTSPDQVKFLIEKSGMRVIKESSVDPKNFYLNRDYLVVIEK